MKLNRYFQALRCNPHHHEGMGDIRITMGQQELIEKQHDTLTQRVEDAEKLLREAKDYVRCEGLLCASHGDWDGSEEASDLEHQIDQWLGGE